MDDESGESMERIGEAPFAELGENSAMLRIQYMMQPVMQPFVQPVVKPVVQRVVSCKGGITVSRIRFAYAPSHMLRFIRRPGRPPMRFAWRSAFRSYKIARF